MPWQNQLNKLKNKLEDYNKQHNILPIGQNSSQQQQQQGGHYNQYPQQYQQHNQYPGQQHQQQQQSQAWGAPPQAGQQTWGAPPQQGQQTWGAPPYQNPQQQQQQHYTSPPEGTQQYSGQEQQYNRPPPVPAYSRPGQQNTHPIAQPQAPPNHPPPSAQAYHPPNKRYWQARFDPSVPVSQEWDQKLGNNNGWGNNELQSYTANAENGFYTGGPDNKLVLRAIANTGNNSFTSARLVSRQRLSRPSGSLTGFLTLPCAQGIWPAFWLLPAEPFNWPHDGEIDIAETWNADCINRSCLHWGFYTPEDSKKHLARETKIDDMAHGGRVVRFDFAWRGDGRMMWYLDDRPVMRAVMPQGCRRIEDWCVILNVAMGGNVCQGVRPRAGAYDMVVHALYMADDLENGGWSRFDAEYGRCPEGNTF